MDQHYNTENNNISDTTKKDMYLSDEDEYTENNNNKYNGKVSTASFGNKRKVDNNEKYSNHRKKLKNDHQNNNTIIINNNSDDDDDYGVKRNNYKEVDENEVEVINHVNNHINGSVDKGGSDSSSDSSSSSESDDSSESDNDEEKEKNNSYGGDDGSDYYDGRQNRNKNKEEEITLPYTNENIYPPHYLDMHLYENTDIGSNSTSSKLLHSLTTEKTFVINRTKYVDAFKKKEMNQFKKKFSIHFEDISKYMSRKIYFKRSPLNEEEDNFKKKLPNHTYNDSPFNQACVLISSSIDYNEVEFVAVPNFAWLFNKRDQCPYNLNILDRLCLDQDTDPHSKLLMDNILKAVCDNMVLKAADGGDVDIFVNINYSNDRSNSGSGGGGAERNNKNSSVINNNDNDDDNNNNDITNNNTADEENETREDILNRYISIIFMILSIMFAVYDKTKGRVNLNIFLVTNKHVSLLGEAHKIVSEFFLKQSTNTALRFSEFFNDYIQEQKQKEEFKTKMLEMYGTMSSTKLLKNHNIHTPNAILLKVLKDNFPKSLNDLNDTKHESILQVLNMLKSNAPESDKDSYMIGSSLPFYDPNNVNINPPTKQLTTKSCFLSSISIDIDEQLKKVDVDLMFKSQIDSPDYAMTVTKTVPTDILYQTKTIDILNSVLTHVTGSIFDKNHFFKINHFFNNKKNSPFNTLKYKLDIVSPLSSEKINQLLKSNFKVNVFSHEVTDEDYMKNFYLETVLSCIISYISVRYNIATTTVAEDDVDDDDEGKGDTKTNHKSILCIEFVKQ